MAEKAEYFIEKSLPEILDLEEKKIFTHTEIKSILRKRTEFEHALARRVVKKEDFLKYAEYEMNLEALRKKRVKRLNIKGKTTISDWAGVRRIFFIFERATQKFHGDIDLWFQYIYYAQHEKSTKVLGKVIASALQFHPTKPKLWIFAGYHELNWNNNMSAARILMQRGLRLNKYSHELWLEYCRMELLYIIKLSTHKGMLEIPGTQDNTNTCKIIQDENLNKATHDTNTTSEITIEKFEENKIISKSTKLNQLSESTINPYDNPVIKGEIPSIIIKTSNEYMPGNIELLESFYHMIESFNDLKCQRRLLDEIVLLIKQISTDLAKVTLITLVLNKFLNNVMDVSFPGILKSSLSSFNTLTTEIDCSITSYEKFCLLLNMFLDQNQLNSNLRIAIQSFLHMTLKKLETQHRLSPKLKNLYQIVI
ncbi:hypothetical protein PCANB_000550 [Pneumocystis canis]|nr:hypothetical protein PCANB_000550 [Pneumocystis canis]